MTLPPCPLCHSAAELEEADGLLIAVCQSCGHRFSPESVIRTRNDRIVTREWRRRLEAK